MRIALSLSGGGTRAAVFHLGVLQRLAKAGLLESVAKVSTVSGGSLAVALIFCHSDKKWPTSTAFTDETFPKLKALLTSTDLFTLGSIAASPAEWRFLPMHRARIIAHLLVSRWGVSGNLRDIAGSPDWLINTTCIETGKNWRFSQRYMGDWTFGHHFDPPFSIAEAAAASAAVPYVLGALRLKLPEEGWYDIDPATDAPRARKHRSLPAISLWDGGAYENLGLEPLFKLDRGMIDCEHIVVSDASGGLTTGTRSPLLSLLRGDLASPRLFDIASDQIRALRSRIFVHGLTTGMASGALIRMGNSVRDIDMKAKRLRSTQSYDIFQADEVATMALKHPTNLSALDAPTFDSIVRHGFEVADATLTTYCRDLVPETTH